MFREGSDNQTTSEEKFIKPTPLVEQRNSDAAHSLSPSLESKPQSLPETKDIVYPVKEKSDSKPINAPRREITPTELPPDESSPPNPVDGSLSWIMEQLPKTPDLDEAKRILREIQITESALYNLSRYNSDSNFAIGTKMPDPDKIQAETNRLIQYKKELENALALKIEPALTEFKDLEDYVDELAETLNNKNFRKVIKSNIVPTKESQPTEVGKKFDFFINEEIDSLLDDGHQLGQWYVSYKETTHLTQPTSSETPMFPPSDEETQTEPIPIFRMEKPAKKSTWEKIATPFRKLTGLFKKAA